MKNDAPKKSRKVTFYSLLSILLIIALTVFCYFVKYPLIIPIFIFVSGIYIWFVEKSSFKLYLQLGLLLTVMMFGAHAVSFWTDVPYYYIPVAATGMLTALLFNSWQLAFVMALVSSMVVSLMLGGSFGMMLTFFLGSLAGIYAVKDVRTRGSIMIAGLFVSFVNVIAVFLLHGDIMNILRQSFVYNSLYPLVANGFICAFVVIATLKLFEMLFGVLTNFSLLELADRNQPVLRRMALEAPGTWQHSLIVSQLAEAAADEIGANALLTRVGAFYHDIGKLVKSEYFTENQMIIGNKHDNLEPSVSRLVLLNHIKEGVELAKKYKLNEKIVDFIPQHHGTGLMYYFYQRALEEAEDGEAVNEADFRYPGPKPQSKETAITLMADSVEGATRALDEPNPSRIEETVKKVINNKFIDGQLDECSLTLKEIDVISTVFIRILSALYHGRVKYPEQKNGSKRKKSPEKNPPQPESRRGLNDTDPQI